MLTFRLDDVRLADYGDRIAIDDRRAWRKIVQNDKAQECVVTVVYRPAPTATGASELIEVELEGTQPGDALCASAGQLAAAALPKLPSQ